MTRRVVHDEARHRYELRDHDGQGAVVAFTDYRIDAGGAGAWIFHHTVTMPEHRNQGMAAEVVAAALDDVRARGGRVVATCWYVDDFLRDHAEYADLREIGF